MREGLLPSSVDRRLCRAYQPTHATLGLTRHRARSPPERKRADIKKTATHGSAKRKILNSEISYGYPIDE